MCIVHSMYHACIGYCKNDINIVNVISTICVFLFVFQRRRPFCYTAEGVLHYFLTLSDMLVESLSVTSLGNNLSEAYV